jgi:hypothetical protein
VCFIPIRPVLLSRPLIDSPVNWRRSFLTAMWSSLRNAACCANPLVPPVSNRRGHAAVPLPMFTKRSWRILYTLQTLSGSELVSLLTVQNYSKCKSIGHLRVNNLLTDENSILDSKDATSLEYKLDSFASVYRRLTGKDVVFEFPVVSQE